MLVSVSGMFCMLVGKLCMCGMFGICGVVNIGCAFVCLVCLACV